MKPIVEKVKSFRTAYQNGSDQMELEVKWAGQDRAIWEPADAVLGNGYNAFSFDRLEKPLAESTPVVTMVD